MENDMKFMLALLAASIVCGQDISTARNPNFQAVIRGATLPAGCNPALGQAYLLTASPYGMYVCTATNKWTAAGGSATFTIGSGANQLPAASAGNSGWILPVGDALNGGDCSVGGGSSAALCRSNGSSWAAVSSGGAVTLPTPGAACQMVGTSTFCVCTTTCTVTPLAPIAGAQLCVRNDVGVSTVITLAAVTSSFYEKTDHSAYGTVHTAATSGGSTSDQICIVGRDATHYLTWSSTGAWTVN